MTRTFYFLQDSFSKQFYTGEANYLGSLSRAAVYHNEVNAEKGMTRVIAGWAHQQKYYPLWIEQATPLGREWAFEQKLEVCRREALTDWGIIILKKTIKI